MMRKIKGAMLKRMHGMITCREFEGFIASYLDDTLDDRRRRVFQWHLRICRECREYLAAYQRAMELGINVLESTDDAIPDDVPEDLIKAILDAQRR